MIEQVVESVLDQGYRTKDIFSKGMKAVGGVEMGDLVSKELESNL